MKPPTGPDIEVSDFWPVYALTFNAVESETEIFPPSDAALLRDMQLEHNRSRQGKRDHRKAAMPRWAYSNGALEPEDLDSLSDSEAFETIPINKDPTQKIGDILEAVPVPGVDPNLYDTNEIMADMQFVGGGSNYINPSKVTATASAIGAESSSSSDSSAVDDLDTFLSMIARAGSQILMKEMTQEKVFEIVGPGASWPEQTAAQIAQEMWLDVEAGSTGKPNQAVEINNWKEMLPFLIQLGSIPPTWLARESLRRLDDRMDLTEAVVEGVPAIVAMNRAQQAGPGVPGSSNPDDQGGNGGDNAPKAQEGNAGSGAPMGDNNNQPKVIRFGSNGQRIGA